MKPQDYVVNLILSVVLIVGTYQFYFLTQRRPLFKTRVFHSPIDEAVPYWPGWAWIYSSTHRATASRACTCRSRC